MGLKERFGFASGGGEARFTWKEFLLMLGLSSLLTGYGIFSIVEFIRGLKPNPLADWEQHRPLTDCFSLSLALAGLLAAWKTIRDCNKIFKGVQSSIGGLKSLDTSLQSQVTQTTTTTVSLNVLQKNLKEVSDALSTRYIGAFPDYLESVDDLLRTPGSKVRMMCDFLGHGSFSNAHMWNPIFAHLIASINRKDDPVHVTILCGRSDVRMKLFQSQFPNLQRDWESIISGGDNAMFLKVVKYFGYDHIHSATFNNFLFAIDREEVDIAEELLRRGRQAIGIVSTNPVTILETPTLLPLYVWIRDEESAIFAFPTHAEATTLGDDGIARAFLTRDRNIVLSLIKTFDRLVDENKNDNSKLRHHS